MLTWIIGYAWTTCWVLAVALSYDLDRFRKPAAIATLVAWPVTAPYLGIRRLFK
jgi:hypothetical protein